MKRVGDVVDCSQEHFDVTSLADAEIGFRGDVFLDPHCCVDARLFRLRSGYWDCLPLDNAFGDFADRFRFGSSAGFDVVLTLDVVNLSDS